MRYRSIVELLPCVLAEEVAAAVLMLAGPSCCVVQTESIGLLGLGVKDPIGSGCADRAH